MDAALEDTHAQVRTLAYIYGQTHVLTHPRTVQTHSQTYTQTQTQTQTQT